MNTNDSRILDLKQSIEKKRAAIQNQPQTYKPETTCILHLKNIGGQSVNLHTLNANELSVMLIAMQMMFNNAYALNMTDVKISGFYFDDWIKDIKGLLQIKKIKQEKEKLDMLEKQLNALLSEDKRTAMEIDNIAALL